MGIRISPFVLYVFILRHRLALLCMCKPYVGIVCLLWSYIVGNDHSLALFGVIVIKRPNVGILGLYKLDALA